MDAIWISLSLSAGRVRVKCQATFMVLPAGGGGGASVVACKVLTSVPGLDEANVVVKATML